jgi:hypothetical protein
VASDTGDGAGPNALIISSCVYHVLLLSSGILSGDDVRIGVEKSVEAVDGLKSAKDIEAVLSLELFEEMEALYCILINIAPIMRTTSNMIIIGLISLFL